MPERGRETEKVKEGGERERGGESIGDEERGIHGHMYVQIHTHKHLHMGCGE